MWQSCVCVCDNLCVCVTKLCVTNLCVEELCVCVTKLCVCVKSVYDEAVCGRVVVCDKVGNKAVFERAEEDGKILSIHWGLRSTLNVQAL